MSLHVYCPHCGTEFDIADTNEHALSNDLPTDGTYFLIPKTTKNSNINIMSLFKNLENATVSDDGTIVIPQGDNDMQIITENPDHYSDAFDEFDDMYGTTNDYDDIEETILNDGYIPNNHLWRRWVMAQMLRHYRSEEDISGFDHYFISGKPYKYSWQTATDEIKTLSRLSGTELTLRERFFNMTVVTEMAIDYEKRFWKYFKKRKIKNDLGYAKSRMSRETIAQHEYIHLNHFGNIYLNDNGAITKSSDMTKSKLKNIIATHVNAITSAKNYKQLYIAMVAFMKNCPMDCKLIKAYSWKNAFKGAGAYYTMDNMIKFHNCKWYVTENNEKIALSANKSLQMLEDTTNSVNKEYYKLYAIMCEFIKDNNFDFEERLKELNVN